MCVDCPERPDGGEGSQRYRRLFVVGVFGCWGPVPDYPGRFNEVLGNARGTFAGERR